MHCVPRFTMNSAQNGLIIVIPQAKTELVVFFSCQANDCIHDVYIINVIPDMLLTWYIQGWSFVDMLMQPFEYKMVSAEFTLRQPNVIHISSGESLTVVFDIWIY